MAKNDKDKKKPTKRVYRKKKTESLGLSALTPLEETENILPEKQLAQVEEVIKNAFLRFYDNAQLKQHKVKDLEHLDGVASEFLKAFMILGYDLNGEKAFIMHATNPHDRDALVEHLRTTLLGIINAQG
jgi:hypothetical protein